MASSPAAKRKLSSSCEAPAETIDWSNNPNGTNHFDDRFADAYMGKTYLSDMSFFVELDQTSIPSHSFIVAPASKVLERCIFGTGSIANPDRVVKVRDCPLAEFHILLRYLYTGLVVEEMTIEKAIILMPLAHYFNLHGLENICAERTKEQLTPKNVCETFDKIHFLDNPFTVKCLEVMEHNTGRLLDDGSLFRMQVPSLDKIMNNDVLNILCESELLTALLCWADGQCTKSNLELNSANRRTVVNGRLYYIRFAAMSGDVFTKCVSKVGKDFFTNDEIVDIVYCIASGRDDCKDTLTKQKFSSKRRRITRRLGVLRGTLYGNSFRHNFEEITQHSPKVYNHLEGFESNQVITCIQDQKQQNIEFYQTDNRYIFTKALSFTTAESDCTKCAFTISFNSESAPCINTMFAGDQKIKLSYKSFITAVFVR